MTCLFISLTHFYCAHSFIFTFKLLYVSLQVANMRSPKCRQIFIQVNFALDPWQKLKISKVPLSCFYPNEI